MTFIKDLAFLQKYTDILTLKSKDRLSQCAIAPQWQGRVMTSTNNGDSGPSFGWINRELVESQKIQEHINVFGGEDRLWLGPEGGQFSIYFEKDAPFDLDHWYVPKELDIEPFAIESVTDSMAAFSKEMQLTNYSGTQFNLRLDRQIELLNPEAFFKQKNLSIDKIQCVAFSSINTMTNIGENEWTKDTGMLSLWILGMLNASPSTTIAIPFKDEIMEEIPVVNSDYFGEVPEARLKIKDGVIYFKGDAQFRSKIGLPPQRTKSVMASFDDNSSVLTIALYNQPQGITEYVNSKWELQDDPFNGDAINSYNDGPPEPGKKGLGHFYELESSSPAAPLQPNQAIAHVHVTMHLTGEKKHLNEISTSLLGVTVDEISNSLK